MGILSDIVNEDKVEMCPEACCGKPITECKCGPDCEHCDCHSKNSAINEGTMIGGLMKYDGQPEGEYADAVAKYKEFMSKPRPPGEATNTMVQGFVFDDDLLDNLGDAEEHGDILDVRFIVQSRLEDFFGDDFELSEGTQGCADCEWIKDETDGDIDTCDDCAAEKRQTNEAEKRWKQTSMSPQEAIAKYGKENVKVKKGALRNGDDMVEVFVESMNEGGNSVEAFMAHVVDHAKEIQADNYRMTDSSYYEFTDEIDTDDEEFMSMPQVQAILKAIPHVDMENTDIKHAIDILASGELLEAETESYSPGDEMEDGVVSNCCGAQLMDYNDGHGRCSDCKEMAAGETDEEFYENKSVMESYTPATGSLKTSYIQLPENTKLIIKHTKGVNEEVRGSRSRNIKALFIENSAGERFRFPHKYLQGAKAMANHVSKGGTPYDAIGESIVTLCTEVAQCTQFLRHVRTNKLTNEGNENIVETVKQKLKEFKNTVKSLQTSKGYNAYQVPTTAIVEEKDKESVDLTDKFMYNTFETANMDAVLETVARIVKERDSMTDLTKNNMNRLYDMIKNKEDFKLNIDPNDPEHPDNEDPIKYSGGNGAMAKLVSHLSYLAMNSKNDEVFNLLSQISGEMYSLPKEHVILLAKIAAYLDKNNKAPAKEPAMEDLAEAMLNSLRRKIA